MQASGQIATGGALHFDMRHLDAIADFSPSKKTISVHPRAGEFFALKARLDPTNKFRNELWNKYYHPEK